MKNIKLTQYSHGAGCGCKISPKLLDSILKSNREKIPYPNLLVGNDTKDDAAAFNKDAKFKSSTAHITAEKPLTTGSNVLVVELKKSGKLINDAEVTFKSFMPAMPGMPAMTSKVKAKDLGNGKYEGKLNLPMSGTWQLHILITPTKGKKSRIKTILNI